jgi:hypothetical protein
VFEPIVLIFAWPVGVFAWVLYDLHRHREPVQEVAPEPAAPAWQQSLGAAA